MNHLAITPPYVLLSRVNGGADKVLEIHFIRLNVISYERNSLSSGPKALSLMHNL